MLGGSGREASKLGLTLVLPMAAHSHCSTPLHPPSDNGANTWAGVKVTTNGFLRACLEARSWWDRIREPPNEREASLLPLQLVHGLLLLLDSGLHSLHNGGLEARPHKESQKPDDDIFISTGHFPWQWLLREENICRGAGALRWSLWAGAGLGPQILSEAHHMDPDSQPSPPQRGLPPATLWKVTDEYVFLYFQRVSP